MLFFLVRLEVFVFVCSSWDLFSTGSKKLKNEVLVPNTPNSPRELRRSGSQRKAQWICTMRSILIHFNSKLTFQLQLSFSRKFSLRFCFTNFLTTRLYKTHTKHDRSRTKRNNGGGGLRKPLFSKNRINSENRKAESIELGKIYPGKIIKNSRKK